MRAATALLPILLALAACTSTGVESPPVEPSGPPPTTTISNEELFKRARQAVVASVKDPDFVKFGPKFERYARATQTGQPYEVVCGTVNAKNSFGGYTGMKMFAWIASEVEGPPVPMVVKLPTWPRVVADEGNDTFQLMTLLLCRDPTKSKRGSW